MLSSVAPGATPSPVRTERPLSPSIATRGTLAAPMRMPMTERQPLDEIDLKILSELQKDGRIRNNELADQGRPLGTAVPAAGSRLARARLCQRDPRHARRKAARLRGDFLRVDPVAEPGPGDAAGIRKIDRGDAAGPAELADFGRRRLSAQMRRAKRRGHAPAACCSSAAMPEVRNIRTFPVLGVAKDAPLPIPDYPAASDPDWSSTGQLDRHATEAQHAPSKIRELRSGP